MATPPNPNDLTRQQLDELDALLQRMLALPLNKVEASTPLPSTDFVPPPLPDLTHSEAPSTSQMVLGAWRSDPATPPAPIPHYQPSREASLSPAFTPLTPAKQPAPMRPIEHPPEESHRPETLMRFFPAEQSPETGEVRLLMPSELDEPTPAMTGTLRGVDAPATPMGFVSAFAHDQDDDYPSTADTEPIAELDFVGHSAFPVITSPVKNEPRSQWVGPPLLLWPLYVVNLIVEWLLGWFGPLGEGLKQTGMKYLLGLLGLVMLVMAAAWAAMGLGWLPWPNSRFGLE